MAPQNERDELLWAWRALVSNPGLEGWLTIPVATGSPCHLRAGRHFPGNEEALLVGFVTSQVPSLDQLPLGRGFCVSVANVADLGQDVVWIALRRQVAGSLDLFTMMALDIAATLRSLRDTTDEIRMRVFISRIRAWQEFMRREDDGVLSPEAEVGLVGELEFLKELISTGLLPAVAIDAWNGPDGVQDFSLGEGAIEVKSTASENAFLAVVGSLEQFDDSEIRPLFLAAVRLALNSTGGTLTGIVSEIRDDLESEPLALAKFNSVLLRTGYLDAFADRYTRRFSRVLLRILPLTDRFPRLTRSNVAIEIQRVRYTIDLDHVTTESVILSDALKQLGVM